MIQFVSVRFILFQVVLYCEKKSWFGLFCDANVVLASFGCCTLFQAVSVFVYVVEICFGCLACFLVVLLCFLLASDDLSDFMMM